MGFRSGDCDGHGKTFILQSGNHFCVDFEICFGSLSCWNVQPRPILSLLEGAVRFSFNICWYLTMYPNKMSRAFGRKTAPQHQRSAPYFTLGMRCFSVWLSFCLRQTHLWCLLPKSFILVSSDHITRPIESLTYIWQTVGALVCSWLTAEAFFWQPYKTTCGDVGGVWW